MRNWVKLGICLSLVPASISAVETLDELPFAQGRYAQEQDCKGLQASEKAGLPRSLNNAFWHLTEDGFTDGWEGACTFHAVFLKENTATAHMICSEGAEMSPALYLFEKEPESGEHGDIHVYSSIVPEGESSQGETYSWCPVVPKSP